MSSEGDTRRTGVSLLLALLAVSAVAFTLRALNVPLVFVGDDVVLRLDDSQYHARRALYTFEHFPAVLDRDPYLGYPEGADVPWPPLYDFALGAAGRALADSRDGLQHVLAWAPVAIGVLTTWLVFAIGSLLAGRGVTLAAAAIFAVLPASTNYSDLGNPDHHAAVAALGALLLALHLAAARPGVSGSRRATLQLGLVAARLAMALCWHGSLLYLALAEVTATAVLSIEGRVGALRAQAWGSALAALLLSPFVARWPAGVGGAWSPIELSWLHVGALAGVAGVAALVCALESRRPADGRGTRALRLAAAGLGVGALLFALPGPREGLAFVRGYFGKEVAWMAGNLESQPLFWGGSTFVARWLFGGFAFVLPLAPLFAALRARSPQRRTGALMLAVWTAVLGALALDQTRYGNDFAPAGSVAFALGLHELRAAVSRRAGPRLAALAAGIAIVALTVPLGLHWSDRVRATLEVVERRSAGADVALETLQGTLLRFAQEVRRTTPSTAGLLDPGATPEYGVIAFPMLGHVIQHLAERPATADNFGPYLSSRSFTDTIRFYRLRSEAEALELAASLGARYVVTADQGGPRRRMLLNRLHRGDGAGNAGVEPLTRFRLVTEGPAGGASIAALKGRRSAPHHVPYKLFEIVPGAALEVRATPGAEVAAEVQVATPTGRRFRYRATATAASDGLARLRVPYATDSEAPARPTGPWRLRSGEAETLVAVPESAVATGATLRVGFGGNP